MKKLLITSTFIIIQTFSTAQDTTNSTASFYHSKFNGRKCSNGDIYSDKKISAASNRYPLGTKVLVTNRNTGKSVEVTINDRMALWIKNRIDLSKAAYRKIADLRTGIQKVKITIL